MLQKYTERTKASGIDPVLFARKLREAELLTNEDVKIAYNEKSSARKRLGYLVVAIMENSTDGAFQRFVDIVGELLNELAKDMKGTLHVKT